MSAIQPGMRVRSNDPRDKHRPVYTVRLIKDGQARLDAEGWGRSVSVSVERIFADGKARNWGWNVVQQETGAGSYLISRRERWPQAEEPPRGQVETFPERLIRLRTEHLYTQWQLAERCGITDDSIRHMERGEHKPRADVLVSLARALNVTIDYLLTGTDPNSALRRAILIGTRPEILLAMARREM